MLMGLNDATSNYCCLWCNIHCDDNLSSMINLIAIQCFCCHVRWNMSVSSHEGRTHNSLKRCAKLRPSKRLGCKHQPLLDVELHHLVVDILHLMLKITDILIWNLITKMANLDLATRQKENREHHDKFASAVHCQCTSMCSMNMNN